VTKTLRPCLVKQILFKKMFIKTDSSLSNVKYALPYITVTIDKFYV
jgi:hypothetical protein